MTKYFGKDARFYLGGYDVSPITVSLKPVRELEMESYAVMDGVDGYHQLPGIGKDSLNFDGLFDDNYMTSLDALRTAATGYQAMIPISTTMGNQALVCEAVKMNKLLKDNITTEILRISAAMVADNRPWDEAALLQIKTQKTTNGTSATLNQTLGTTYGGAAYIQAFEQTGGTGCTVSIYHSTDNFVASNDLLTAFTAFTGITTERKAIVGNIYQYIRYNWVFAGSAPYTGTFAICLKRNTV